MMDMLLSPPADGLDGPNVTAYYRASNNVLDFLKMDNRADSGRPFDRIGYQRSCILERYKAITAVAPKARAAGLLVPDDPIQLLDMLNNGREVLRQISENSEYVKVLNDVTTLNDLAIKELKHEIDFSRRAMPQPTSVSISFNGIGGLPSAVVDSDILKRQQAFNKLAEINFNKRKVRMLLAVERKKDLATDIFVCWRKLRDATGYKLSVRNVFAETSKEFDLGAPVFSSLPDADASFMREKVMPLFPSLTESDVVVSVFRDIPSDLLYSFRVKAYQKIATGKCDIFRVKTNRLSLSSSEIASIPDMIKKFGALDPSDLTPYPFISELIYGDSGFGWLLAGVNVLGSFERGEDAATVRGYSYLGADVKFIMEKIISGKFFIPVDRNEMVSKFDQSIQSFGLPKTLADVLEKTGVLFFFDEREHFDVDTVVFDQEAALTETSLLSTVISSIDPSSLTVNPQNVYSNVTRAVKQSGGGKLVLRLGVEPPKLDKEKNAIDLLTFSGITRFLNVIVDASRRSS